MSIHRLLAGFVALGLVVAACSGSATPPPSAASASVAAIASASASASPSPSPSPSVKPSPTPAPTPTPAPSPVTMTLASHVWWGGFAIDVSGATYDPLKHKLNITATFLNTSTAANDVSGLGAELNVFWNSTYIQGYIPIGAVPPGGTVRADIQVTVPKDFTPDTAVLTFGQPNEHQATVPLNGSAAASEQPTALTVSGTVKMGKYVTYALKSGMLMPAACSGYANKIKFGALKKDEMSIILFGTAANADPAYDGTIDQAFVTAPDGSTSASLPTVYLTLASKATVRDYGLCFAVPAPGSGAYKLSLHEYRSKLTASVPFQVP
jgi:hypothetical protein